jgi:hypothetical protein
MAVAAPARARASRRSSAAQPKPQPLAVALEWIEAHCVIPDGFRQAQPFVLYQYQARYLQHFYMVRPDAMWVPSNPVKAPAFVYRRGLLVGPQKLGKDPMEAAQICLEGVGPALFGGWAGRDEGYACRDHGCRCGWEYPYDPGEPMGMHWPTALIQVTAFSEKATDNTYDALRPMIELGPLADLIPRTGEDFIRLPNGGRIDTVTSESRSRLGNRITFASQGELGIWDHPTAMDKVADTQWRGLAGMGGRASATTNAWDPAQRSVAQVMHEQADDDVYVQFDQPPANLSFTNKDERRRILRAVYPPDTLVPNGHIDLDSIEAEAASLLKRDPAQAARFFGNRIVTGTGKAFDLDVWAKRARPHGDCPGTTITLGFDGSKSGDHTALIATCVLCGWQWPVGIWDPAQYGGAIPRDEVNAAVDSVFAEYTVWRMYYDPFYWRDEGAAWAGTYGDDRVKSWETNRNRPMASAVAGFATAINDGSLSHSGDRVYTQHIGNAHKRALLDRDEQGQHLWVLQKASADSMAKKDGADAGVLSWLARTEAVAAGVGKVFTSVYETRGILTL